MSQYASSRDRIDKAKHEVFLILEDAPECNLENGERRRIEEREQIEWLLCNERGTTETAAERAIDELLRDKFLVERPYRAYSPIQYLDRPDLTHATSGLTTTEKEWTPASATDPIIEPLADVAEVVPTGDLVTVQTAPPKADPPPDEIPALSHRQYVTLQTLLKMRATSADARQTTAKIVERAEGKAADYVQFKRDIASLKAAGFIDTKSGAGGGCWLTTEGRKLANRLS